MKRISKFKYARDKKVNKLWRNKINIKAVIFCISSIVGLILFIIARIIATDARGNSSIGGEYFLLLIPLISWGVFENILLQKKVSKTPEFDENGVYITSVNSKHNNIDCKKHK